MSPEQEKPAQAKLAEVLVDDVTWRCATRPRRAEWLQAISELIEDATLTAPQAVPLRAYITVERDGIRGEFHDPSGELIGQLDLPRATIAPIFREYVTLLQGIGSQDGGYSPQIEALDIARRLIHNDAADLVIRHSVGVVPDHQSARLLFTLLVLLTHDTTKMF